jgi:hypothetical protein
MTTRRAATRCGVGPLSGYAAANSKQGPRTAGMRSSAIAEGSLRSSVEPTGPLLARADDSRRQNGIKVNHLKDEEANA